LAKHRGDLRIDNPEGWRPPHYKAAHDAFGKAWPAAAPLPSRVMSYRDS